MTERTKTRKRVTWAHIVTFVLATAISYVLAVVSSLIFPVLGAPGVSALYVAAAIYVPLGIWMGMWGCLAGYISCFFLGLWPSGYTPLQSFIWSWADFIEALAPAAIFRLLKVDPDFSVKRGWAAKAFPPLIALGPIILLLAVAALVRWADTMREPFTTIYTFAFYTGLALAVIGVVLGLSVGHRKTWAAHIAGVILASVLSGIWGATLGEPFTTIYVYSVYAGLALAVIGVVLGLSVGHRKTWAAHIAGVILASVLSGIWGAGTLTLWNLPPPLPAELFWPVFTGWVMGDLIVLSVLSTALLVALTPVFKRTGLYVEGWWA